MDEQKLEKLLQQSGASEIRVKPEKVDSVIDTVEYQIFQPTFTVCVVTLRNGFKVVGTSAWVDPANFNEYIGRQLAFERARRQIWELEGYLLCQKTYESPATAQM